MNGLPDAILTVEHGTELLLISVADTRVTLNVKMTVQEARKFWSDLGREIEEFDREHPS